jgi:uncharacterized DUF497 family protein
MGVEFQWSTAKAKRNLKKHGVSFESAKQVFFDPHVIVTEDCEVGSEIRYHAIGYPRSGLLLAVVFVDRSEQGREIVRIVSARKADAYEQGAYSDQFTQRN